MIPLSRLTERETLFLELLAAGKASKEIAREIGLNDGTVRIALSALYRKIGVKNSTSAATWWTRKNAAAIDLEERPSQIEVPAVQETTTEDHIPSFPQPQYDYAGTTSFGRHALKHGLFTALGSMSVYLGYRPRAVEMRTANDPGEAAAALSWMFEQLLSGRFNSAVMAWSVLSERARRGQSYTLAALMRALRGERLEGLPITTSHAEQRLIANAQAWLLDGDPDAVDRIDDLVFELPQHHAARHAALAVLYYGAQRIPAWDRAMAAAETLMADALATQKRLADAGLDKLLSRAVPPKLVAKADPAAVATAEDINICDVRR